MAMTDERTAFEQQVTKGVKSEKLRAHLLERGRAGYVHTFTLQAREFWLAALRYAEGGHDDG